MSIRAIGMPRPLAGLILLGMCRQHRAQATNLRDRDLSVGEIEDRARRRGRLQLATGSEGAPHGPDRAT